VLSERFIVFEGGLLAGIFVARSATKWLRLKGYRRTSEQSRHRM
jgi:hypothetical protein